MGGSSWWSARACQSMEENQGWARISLMPRPRQPRRVLGLRSSSCAMQSLASALMLAGYSTVCSTECCPWLSWHQAHHFLRAAVHFSLGDFL